MNDKLELRATLASVRKLRSERIRRRRQLRRELADVERLLALDELTVGRLKHAIYDRKPTAQTR